MNIPAAIILICLFYTVTIIITIATRNDSNAAIRYYPLLMWTLTSLLAAIVVLNY